MKLAVEKTILIEAPVDAVKPHLVDLSAWKTWSPWSVLEPDHHQELDGVMGEVGSKMSWQGDIIGAGELSLAEDLGDKLNLDLTFLKPMKSEAKTSFEIKAVGESTEVRWLMDSSLPFFLFFFKGMMQSLIGMDYDRGLTMLKALIEEGKVDADTHNEGVNTFGGFDFIGIKRTSDLAEMPDIMQQDFSKIMQQCVDQAVEPEHVLSIYNKVNLSKQLFTYTSAISAESFDVQALGDDVVHGYVRQQEMLEIKHRGSYKFIGNAWTMGNMILRANKMKSNGKPFEYYHNDPADTPERELLTSVYFPVK